MRLTSASQLTCVLFMIFVLGVSSFTGSRFMSASARMMRLHSTPEASPPAASPPAAPQKGFGKVVEKVEKVEEIDAGTRTYTSQAKRGVPEYNVFMRPTNGSETEWVPVGSMTIPRDTPVAKAVYEVEAELLKGTFKLYPKLKAFSDTRLNKEGIFEYGYCLKAFPDEPITLIPSPESQAEEANNKGFFKNWLNSITNPIDNSALKNPGAMTLKQ